MLPLYRSATGTFVASSGADISPQDLQLNILIELRAVNAIAIQLQRGLVTETVQQIRNEVVAATSNGTT